MNSTWLTELVAPSATVAQGEQARLRRRVVPKFRSPSSPPPRAPGGPGSELGSSPGYRASGPPAARPDPLSPAEPVGDNSLPGPPGLDLSFTGFCARIAAGSRVLRTEGRT
eukprot:483637-Hanusia_phi.AAC.1